MKTLNIISILLISLLAIQSGCKKDTTNPDGLACLLTRITEPGGETGGTVSHIIEYNEQGKPERYYDADNPGNYISITWNGDDLKEIFKYQDGNPTKKYTYVRNEDTLSVLVETFYKASSFEKIVYILDTNNRPVKEQWYWQNSDGSWEPANYYTYTWENGNIAKSEQWFTDKVYTVTYEYDDKFNAYASLGLLYDVKAYNKNNISKETYEYTSGGTDITTYDYLYTEKGYPFKLTKTYSNNTTEEISFEYDCN